MVRYVNSTRYEALEATRMPLDEEWPLRREQLADDILEAEALAEREAFYTDALRDALAAMSDGFTVDATTLARFVQHDGEYPYLKADDARVFCGRGGLTVRRRCDCGDVLDVVVGSRGELVAAVEGVLAEVGHRCSGEAW